MTCRLCEERGKTWKGSDPICYFDDFEGNWNCATLNAIRQVCYDVLKGVCHIFYDDEHCVLMDIGFVQCNGVWFGYGLYVQWYKCRGRTVRLLVMSDDEPRRPTEGELLAIIDYYGGGMNNGHT